MIYTIASSAHADMDAILATIARENPHAAYKWHADLVGKFEAIANFPHMGRQRDDIRVGIYCFPYGNYLVFYKITADAIVVVHVVHGARNLPEFFRSEEAEEPTPSRTR